MEAARQRYENQIRDEESKASHYTSMIEKLEAKEQDMIDRLRKTQNTHSAFQKDLERINQNQDPEGPLASLKDLGSNSGKKRLFASPKVLVSPKKFDIGRSPTEKREKGSSGKKKQYTSHTLYQVNDFYR